MKKLKNFLITAAIFATSISFATSVHALRDPWQDSLSRATDQGNFSTFEKVYKNTDLVSDDDYKFARAIDQKNRSYLENNCANWKYDKYCQWGVRAVTHQLFHTIGGIGGHLDDDFLNFLLEQGIITDAFRELFTWAVFDGNCDSFVQNFHKRFPKTKIAPAGSVEGINRCGDVAYDMHKNDLLSIECLTKLTPYTHPSTLLYALFRYAPADDTEKFAAAAQFLIDKGAEVNTISKITHYSIFEEALFPPCHLEVNIEPFKVYFLLTHGVKTDYYKKEQYHKPPLEQFRIDYDRHYRARKESTLKVSAETLNHQQFINYILELYKETEGNLPPYEQILSQYKFHDPFSKFGCCTIL